MEKILKFPQISEFWRSVITVHLGVCLLTICSLVKIPFYPVSMTLHTVAVFIIALTQRPVPAFITVALYLFWGTCGFPVFGGVSKPYWMLGATGGYYVAFPIAAYLISKLAKKNSVHLAIACGQIVIFFFGFLWLSSFYGGKIAFLNGVLFFIPSALIKNFITPYIIWIFKND